MHNTHHYPQILVVSHPRARSCGATSTEMTSCTVLIDLYGLPAQSQTTYVIPGPPLYGSTAPPPPPSSVPTSKPPSSSPTAPPTSAPSSSPSSVGTVAHYGQCGGNGYTGPTVCVAPWACSVINRKYRLPFRTFVAVLTACVQLTTLNACDCARVEFYGVLQRNIWGI